LTSTEKFAGLIIGAFIVGGALKLFNIDLPKLLAEVPLVEGQVVEVDTTPPPGPFDEPIGIIPSPDISEISGGGPEDIPIGTETDTVSFQRAACERVGGTFDELNFVCVFTRPPELGPIGGTVPLALEEPEPTIDISDIDVTQSLQGVTTGTVSEAEAAIRARIAFLQG